MSRKVVMLGATRGMGRSLARKLAARGDRLFLLGRQLEDVQRSASDLTIRAGLESKAAIDVGVGAALCDLSKPETFGPALDAAEAALGGFDTVILTAGMFATQAVLENDLELTRNLLTVDFANTVVFCEHVRRRLLARGGGTLCVFSSVAGDRGRKPVVIYGAAKAGLSRYLEALDHAYRTKGLVTVCVKPGFVKTGMTDGLPVPPFAGEPDGVADAVIKAIDKGKPEIYAPGMWALIMAVIKGLPRFVMRRLSF